MHGGVLKIVVAMSTGFRHEKKSDDVLASVSSSVFFFFCSHISSHKVSYHSTILNPDKAARDAGEEEYHRKCCQFQGEFLFLQV